MYIHTHRVCMETEWDFTSPNTKWLLKSVLLAWSTYQIYTNIAFINYASQSIVSYWIIKYSLDVMWITSRYKAHTQNTNGKCIYKYCHFFGILCPNTGWWFSLGLFFFISFFSAFLCSIHTRHRSNYAHTYIGNNGAEGKEEKKSIHGACMKTMNTWEKEWPIRSETKTRDRKREGNSAKNSTGKEK